MNILVIDNAEQLAPRLAELAIEVTSIADEVQALNAVERHKPKIILLDYAFLGERTPDYIRLLLEASTDSRLVVVGINVSEDDIIHCLLMGANGYQDKQQLPNYIDKLLRAVAEGEAWISRKMVTRILDALRQISSETLLA